MIVLRNYQLDFVEAIRAEFRAGRKRVLGCSPTGSGKSCCFAYVTQGAVAKGNRIVIVAHRSEILDQISKTLRLFEVDHGRIQSGEPIVPHYAVQVAAIQTLVNRMGQLQEPDLVVYDECAHAANSTSVKMFTAWPNAKYLGVTATPERLDGKGLGEFFESMVHGPPAAWLMDNGFLARPEYYGVPPNQALDFSEIGKVGGDFNKGKVAELVDKPKITGSAVQHYLRICPGARAIAFCVTLEHARHVCLEFLEAGVSSEVIDGKLSDVDRAARVENLRTGKTRVMVSCDLVSEGFDVPAVECGILLRPTWSLSLHLQQLGRVLRPKPDGGPAWILDHVGNCARHGFAESPREWSLEGKKARTKNEAVISVSQCKVCFAVFQGSACPQCGSIPEPKPRAIEETEGTLVKLSPEEKLAATVKRKSEEAKAITYEQLVALAESRNYSKPKAWAWMRYSRSWRRFVKPKQETATSMTKEQWAEKLTGREIGEELTEDEEKQARKDGVLIVFGASDDLCEFRGVIHDEADCYDGGTIPIHSKGPLDVDHDNCDCKFCGYPAAKAKCAEIEAVWGEGDCSWTYKTSLPHATFEIVEGDEKYCRGMVIDGKELPVL